MRNEKIFNFRLLPAEKYRVDQILAIGIFLSYENLYENDQLLNYLTNQKMILVQRILT